MFVIAALSVTCPWRLSTPMLVAGHVMVIAQFAASFVLMMRIAVVRWLRELRKPRVIGNINLAGVRSWKQGSLRAIVSRLRELRKSRVIGNINWAGVHPWKGALNKASLERCYGGAALPLDFGE
jgi:hypothetical protein